MSNVFQLSTGVATEIKIARLVPADFDDWWAMYPRKAAKKGAQRAWQKMRVAEREAAMDALPLHIENWRLRGVERVYIPHPATWLNGGRWDDELDPVEKVKSAGRPVVEAWWTSDVLMERKGIEVGVGRPQPGWSRFEYRARINQALQGQEGRVA